MSIETVSHFVADFQCTIGIGGNLTISVFVPGKGRWAGQNISFC